MASEAVWQVGKELVKGVIIGGAGVYAGKKMEAQAADISGRPSET